MLSRYLGTRPSRQKFLALPLRRQHKIALELLERLLQNPDLLPEYRILEKWLHLEELSLEKASLERRYYEHSLIAYPNAPESTFLLDIRHFDTLSQEPFLPYDIYLDNLRSAFNVGSILRSNEAFRLGKVFFGGYTPLPHEQKVQKTAMGTALLSPYEKQESIEGLKRPFIALETKKEALKLHSFTFPESCTLILGNEALGISSHILKEVDIVLEIPLVGGKNSLNVASSFAIVAYEIRRQRAPS